MTARAAKAMAMMAAVILAVASCASPSDTPTPTQKEPSSVPSSTLPPSGDPAFNSSSVPTIDGWQSDFSDEFDRGPRRNDEWEAYGHGVQRPTGGAMGVYKIENTTIENGTLNLRYHYRDGEWTSAGVSSRPTFHAVGGRWEFRARFPRGQGLGYAFLLWPQDDVGPTEVNIAEGTVNGPVYTFYHYLTPSGEYEKEERLLEVEDLTQWHTYGVILEGGQVTYTFDGKPWATVEVEQVTDVPLRIAFQTGALDPDKPGARHFGGGVPGGVPGEKTPADASIRIDWVAHYVRDGSAG